MKAESNKSQIPMWLKGVSLWAMLLVFALTSIGCASLYVATMRNEFGATKKEVKGWYGDGDVYPSLYHSTYIASAVEVPIWVCGGDDPLDGAYIRKFRWVGIPCAVIDVPISLMLDTLMLPMDAYNVLK